MLAVRTSLIAGCILLPLGRNGLASDGLNEPVTFQQPDSGHQLWLVSTRHASSCPSLDQTSHLRYWRSDSDCNWKVSSIDEVLGADDPRIRTLVYVHENRVSERDLIRRLPTVLHQLSSFAPAGQRFRLIAVTWPSDRIGHRQRPDVRIKARRSEAHGFYLAWLLDQIRPDVPITLFGDSFGPRMISASLHCLAGGSIQGQRLAHRKYPVRRGVRAVLMSAALDAHWLSPGKRYGLALTQVERMLITVNPADPALRWYPRMDHLLAKGPQALGFVGIPCSLSQSQHAGKVMELNVSCLVGSTHSWQAYEGSPQIMEQVAPHLFGAWD